MKFPSCTYCDTFASWQRPWDKTRLCINHFNKSFLKRVQRTINKYDLFTRDDVIAIGVSGGKDSVVMLDVMTKLQAKFPTRIIAITIDEGIENYRKDGIKYATIAAERARVEHHFFTYKDRFGYGLDEAIVLLGQDRKAPCSYCGPFRRTLLNEAAREVGATKLVTGHNADDEAQTMLMNLMRGDLMKTLYSNPIPKFKNEAFVNRVKPFRRTTEQEIVLYANLNGIPYQEQSCPHAVEAYRGKIRDILTQLMEEDPSVLFSIINSADSLHEMAAKLPKTADHMKNDQINNCKVCGEPTNNQQCNSCRLVSEIHHAAGLKIDEISP